MKKPICLLNKFTVYYEIGIKDFEIICTTHWMMEKTHKQNTVL